MSYTGGTTALYSINAVNPRPVTSSVAGVSYAASAYVRAAAPSSVSMPVISAIREWLPGNTILCTQQSTRVALTSSFQRISVSYTARNSGDSIDAYVLQFSPSPGNAFDVDDVWMSQT